MWNIGVKQNMQGWDNLKRVREFGTEVKEFNKPLEDKDTFGGVIAGNMLCHGILT